MSPGFKTLEERRSSVKCSSETGSADIFHRILDLSRLIFSSFLYISIINEPKILLKSQKQHFLIGHFPQSPIPNPSINSLHSYAPLWVSSTFRICSRLTIRSMKRAGKNIRIRKSLTIISKNRFAKQNLPLMDARRKAKINIPKAAPNR